MSWAPSKHVVEARRLSWGAHVGVGGGLHCGEFVPFGRNAAVQADFVLQTV